MGIHDGGAPEVLIGGLPSPLVASPDGELHPGPPFLVAPQGDILPDDPGHVLRGVQDKLQVVGRRLFGDLGDDVGRRGGGEPRVQHGGRDPDPLLPTGLPVRMEPGAIE